MASIEQLEASLPNGLQDAKLLGVKVDYERGEVVMSIDADASDPDASNKGRYRRGELYITGLMFSYRGSALTLPRCTMRR